jgi:hypothetical protein
MVGAKVAEVKNGEQHWQTTTRRQDVGAALMGVTRMRLPMSLPCSRDITAVDRSDGLGESRASGMSSSGRCGIGGIRSGPDQKYGQARAATMIYFSVALYSKYNYASPIGPPGEKFRLFYAVGKFDDSKFAYLGDVRPFSPALNIVADSN